MLNTVNRDENAILYAVSLVLGCPSETQSHHKAKEIPIIKLQSEKISCNLEHRCFLGLVSTREMFLSGKYKKIVVCVPEGGGGVGRPTMTVKG